MPTGEGQGRRGRGAGLLPDASAPGCWLSESRGAVLLKSRRPGVAGATVVTFPVDGRLTSSPPAAGALVVGVTVGSSSALADAGVLVAMGFAEEGAVRCARSAAVRLVTSRTEVAFVVAA
jgi:hypothetical protein